MRDQCKPYFSLRLFGMFGLINKGAAFTDVMVSKKNKVHTYPLLVEEKEMNPPHFLGMLHPQVRRFLSPSGGYSVKYFKLADPVKDELNRAVWKTSVPKWAVQKLKTVLIKEEDGLYFTFKISNVEALIFPTGILSIYINIEPHFEISEKNVETTGKMMINVLNRSGLTSKENKFRPVKLMRLFADQRQKESVERRLLKSKSGGIDIVNGLLGEEISIGDIISGTLTKNYNSLMGDRFLTCSFLKTGWDGKGRAFDSKNYIDLVRQSRGENDYYRPCETECTPGKNGIINTFENVAFALSGEGIACWVKPDEKQKFLHSQFKERYDTIYLNLYLLALHQRYALVHMAQLLDRTTPPVEALTQYNESVKKGRIETVENLSEQLRNLRMEIANFYLRAFFQQPAVLTNNQQFYQGLQDVLGVSNLLKEVEHATLELDNLIGKLHDKKIEEFDKQKRTEQNQQHNDLLRKIKDLISEQEQAVQNELVLTLVVEFAALPYYLFNFMDHAVHAPKLVSIFTAALVTIGTMGYTFYKFLKKKKTKNLKYSNNNK